MKLNYDFILSFYYSQTVVCTIYREMKSSECSTGTSQRARKTLSLTVPKVHVYLTFISRMWLNVMLFVCTGSGELPRTIMLTKAVLKLLCLRSTSRNRISYLLGIEPQDVLLIKKPTCCITRFCVH